MRTLLFISSAVILFSGCSAPETKVNEPILMSYNNTEPNDWNSLYTIKKSDNAHSGMNVAFVDASTEYSMGYLKSIENISKSKLDSVTFSYWAFCKDNKAKAQTVISIDLPDNAKNLFWAGHPMQDKVKEYNKWIKITESFKLPPNIDTKSVLKLYVWNNSKEEILLDDFKVEFY